jgi:hypothetical protein
MRQPRIDYSDALDQALSELEGTIRERDRLNAEIVKLTNTVRMLSGMVKEDRERTRKLHALLGWASVAGPGLVDGVRVALKKAGDHGLTAIETRDALRNSGFDLSEFVNPLASVHTTLKRLAGQGEAAYGQERDGKPVYVWTDSYGGSWLSNLTSVLEDQRRDARIAAAEAKLSRKKS